MELVYLWVEKYKNIYKQGFNFSPRFECEYVDGNLTICDKKKNECKDNDYIENFFGDNINITAIVGKNGSGKSSLLSFLFNYMSNENLKKNFIMIFQDSDLKTFSTIKIDTNIDYELLKSNQCSLFFEKYFQKIFIDYSLDYNNKLDDKIKYLYPNKKKTIYEIQEEDKILLKEYMIGHSHNKSVNFISDEIIFSYNISTEETFYKKINDKLWKAIEDYIRKYENEIMFSPENNKPLKNKFRIVELSILLYILKMIILFPKAWWLEKDFNSKNDLLRDLYSLLEKNVNNIKNNLEEQIITVNILNPYEHINKIEILLNKYKDLKKEKETFERFISDTYNLNFSKLEFGIKINKDTYNILNTLPIFFTHDYIDSIKKIKYTHLSTGEKFFLLYNSIISSFINNSITNYFIFLDEPLNNFHPSWQQKFLLHLIENYKDNHHLKLHFIITTHSPFLISDLPKENVIFLDTDEKGNCKVVDGLKDKKQTFGANIHTLLSDGFFMDGGLMGELAKGKINEVYNFLSDEHYNGDMTRKNAEQIIKIIGEPVLQKELQKLFDKSIDIDDQIKAYENEIARLKAKKEKQ